MNDLIPLVLYGAGGMGREVTRIVSRINDAHPTYDLLGFVDDTEGVVGEVRSGFPILGDFEWLVEHKDEVACCCTVGYPKAREKMQERMENAGLKLVSLVDPKSIIEPGAEYGIGTIIQHDCCLSVDVKLGKGVFLNAYTDIGHDVQMGDYCVCAPRVQISGNCKIGNVVSIGGMCFLNPKSRIGDHAIVAPMSCVYGKVRAGIHVLGNPAKKIEI